MELEGERDSGENWISANSKPKDAVEEAKAPIGEQEI